METGVSCLVMLAQCWDGTRLDRCPLQRLWVANGLSPVFSCIFLIQNVKHEILLSLHRNVAGSSSAPWHSAVGSATWSSA